MLRLAATATGSVLHALTLTNRNGRLGVGGGGAHALLDLAGHGQEGLLDVGSALCGGLEEWNAEAVCEFLYQRLESSHGRGSPCTTYLCHGVLNNLLISHIGLVAYEQLVDALSGIAVDLLKPLLYVVERVHVGDIVDDADTVSATVV
jgi:hypothetical protein